MGYFRGGDNKRGLFALLKPSGAETANSTHEWVNRKQFGVATVEVDVTAASGTTPSLVVVVEGSNDNGATWTELGRIGSDGYSVGSVAQAPTGFAAAGSARGVFAAPEYVRTRSVIGGTTPSFTYSVGVSVN